MDSECAHGKRKRFGTTKAGQQRYRCRDCGRTFTDSTSKLDGMRIGTDRAERIISLLCEGMSVSATARFTDTDPHTILDLLVIVGERCKRFLEREIRGIVVEDVQLDEVWQFIGCKEKTAKRLGKAGGPVGDSYCFTGIERHTKLIVAWHFGRRTQEDTDAFCEKLRFATAGHYQVSTDGWQPYRVSIPIELASMVDYGVVVKVFGSPPPEEQRQYSPAKITAIRKERAWGKPDEEKICTSHVERSNGTLRCFVKRMGRLTYCFSKLWQNHAAALALFFAHYNYCRRHRSLKGETPAMATGLANEVWTVADLLARIGNT